MQLSADIHADKEGPALVMLRPFRLAGICSAAPIARCSVTASTNHKLKMVPHPTLGWRNERLAYRGEGGKHFETFGVGSQVWNVVCRDQTRMRFFKEAENDSYCDVSVTDTFSQPIGALSLVADRLEDGKGGNDLLAAPGNPCLGYVAMKGFLVEETHRFLAHTRGERSDVQCVTTRRFGTRKHGTCSRHEAIEIIEDTVAFDQRLAAVQDQRRYARQRVVGPDFVRIAEGRPGAVLEWKLIKL